MFLDSGWMDEVTRNYLLGEMDDKVYGQRIESIRRFERQLTDNGYLVMKFFCHISKKEQKKRIEYLEDNVDTRWRVSDNDRWQNHHYKQCQECYSRYLEDTNFPAAPWYVVDGSSKKWAELQTLELLTEGIEIALQNQSLAVPLLQNVFPLAKCPFCRRSDWINPLQRKNIRKSFPDCKSILGSFITGCTAKEYRWSSFMKAGMQRERAEISKGSREPLIRGGMRSIPLQVRNPMKRQGIICGVSGPGFQRPAILPFLTEAGTAE